MKKTRITPFLSRHSKQVGPPLGYWSKLGPSIIWCDVTRKRLCRTLPVASPAGIDSGG